MKIFEPNVDHESEYEGAYDSNPELYFPSLLVHDEKMSEKLRYSKNLQNFSIFEEGKGE